MSKSVFWYHMGWLHRSWMILLDLGWQNLRVREANSFFTIGRAACQQTLFGNTIFLGAEDPVVTLSTVVTILVTEDQPILCTQNWRGRGSIVMTTVSHFDGSSAPKLIFKGISNNWTLLILCPQTIFIPNAVWFEIESRRDNVSPSSKRHPAFPCLLTVIKISYNQLQHQLAQNWVHLVQHFDQ